MLLNKTGQEFAREMFANGGQHLAVSVASNEWPTIIEGHNLYWLKMRGVKYLVIHHARDVGELFPAGVVAQIRRIRLAAEKAARHGIILLVYIHPAGATNAGFASFDQFVGWYKTVKQLYNVGGVFGDGSTMSDYNMGRLRDETAAEIILHASQRSKEGIQSWHLDAVLRGEGKEPRSAFDLRWNQYKLPRTVSLAKIAFTSPIMQPPPVGIGPHGCMAELLNREVFMWLGWWMVRTGGPWATFWNREIRPLFNKRGKG